MANPTDRSGIPQSEAQVLAKRLAKKKDRVEELTGLLRRAEEVMRAWGMQDEHPILMGDIQDALIEADSQKNSTPSVAAVTEGDNRSMRQVEVGQPVQVAANKYEGPGEISDETYYGSPLVHLPHGLHLAVEIPCGNVHLYPIEHVAPAAEDGSDE